MNVLQQMGGGQATPANQGVQSRQPQAPNRNQPANATPAPAVPATPAPAAAPTPAPAPAPAAAAATPAPAAASSSNSASLAASLNRLAASLLAQQQAAQQASNSPSLTEILDPERLIPLVESDSKLAESLLQYLPPEQRQPQDLKTHLRSPQFRQALARMSALLNSENFGHVMGSLGLPIGAGFGVDALLEAIEAMAKKEADDKMKD